MKTLIALFIFLAFIWIPVFFDVYSWKVGLIMTLMISIGAYFIDKYISKKD